MSDANERIIRRGYKALNAGDLEGGKELLAPDCEIRTRFTSLSGRTYRGHAGADAWAAEVSESWEGIEQTPERFIPVDDEKTIVIVRFRGRGRGSGVEIDEALVVVWTIRDDKVVRVDAHASLEDALKATGASE